MNGFPNLPTDNLYKFLAIAGVSIALFSIYLMVTRAETSWKMRSELEKEESAIEVEEKQVEEARKKLKQQTGPEAKALEKARNDIATRKARLGADWQSAKRFMELNLAVVTDLRVAHYIGYAIAVLGFFLWYYEVQRHLDKALREQKPKSE